MFINVFSPTKYLRLLSFLILLQCIININAYKQVDNDEDFVDVGVRLVGGKRDALIADLIAAERNVINVGHIDGVGLYHFYIRRKRANRSKRAIDEAIEDLKRDERIEFVTVGEPLERSKRELLNDEHMESLIKKHHQSSYQNRMNYVDIDASSLKMSFNDILYSKQWYLENEGQLDTPANHDINVVQAWRNGYSGKGISICIVDDGVDHRHPDIADLYRPELSYDLNDLKDPYHDPLPSSDDGVNSHGTHCAGAAAGKANNEVCGVGVAYGASIAGIRILDGPITTLLEARALTMFASETDIKSASWGPTDDGTVMDAPTGIINAALDYSVKYGRHGKGNVFVWASGNGGGASDDCGADGYVSHQNIISIGSINHLGESTYFDESCPSTMAVAYTGGPHTKSQSEDLMPIGVVTTDVGGRCTTSFFGTSGAAPVAAGAFAIVLEANPELGYRDVMHIIARTARIPSLSDADSWIINGAGYHVSDKYGFGVLDVGRMTALAQKWTNVDERQDCYQEYSNIKRPLGLGTTVEVTIDVKGCKNIESIEHVVANISYSFHRRGDVKVTIISPSQTASEMLSFRDKDATHKAVVFFPFLSTHHWGESVTGTWTLRIETRKPQDSISRRSASAYDGPSEVDHFGLRIYGANDPTKKNEVELKKRDHTTAYIPSKKEIETIYQDELEKRAVPNLMQKRDHEIFVKQRELENKIKST